MNISPQWSLLFSRPILGRKNNYLIQKKCNTMTTSIFLEGYFIYYPVSIRYGSLNDHLNPFWIIFIRMTVITLKDKNTFTPGSRTGDLHRLSAVMFFTMMPVFEGYKVPV